MVGFVFGCRVVVGVDICVDLVGGVGAGGDGVVVVVEYGGNGGIL